LRSDLQDAGVFDTLEEARALIECWPLSVVRQRIQAM
jgi:hypothetical protein